MTRWPLLASIAYVVAVFTGLFLVPAAPGVSASGAELVRYFQQNAGAVRIETWLGAASLVPLAALIAHLRSFLRGTGRDVTMLGAVALICTTTVWLWFGAGLALHATDLQPGTARTIANVSAYFAPLLTVPVVMLVTPIGVAAWRGTDGLASWLGPLTALFAIEQCVETITILSTHGFTAPAGPMNLTIGAGLFLIWIIAAGVASTSSTERTPAAATAP